MTDDPFIRLRKIADTDYEIFPLLKQRYSPRTFYPSAIRKNHLNKLFEAVRWSASSFNIQPWRFIYAASGTVAFEKIVSCLSESNKIWAPNAPLLMLGIYKVNDPEGEENFHALHDLGLCLGNMTVQAQYMGIALHHMAGLNREKAELLFNIPDGYQVATAIAVGYYGGDDEALGKKYRKMEREERWRKPQGEFAFKEGWESNDEN